MAIEKIELNLSKHLDVFNDAAITFDSSVNFVYGENGTGKTTIASEIKEQLSEKYDVCEFKDFTDLVGDNGRLNAISLGKINTELQKKIDNSIEKISEYKKALTEPEDYENNNVYSILAEANKNYEAQRVKLDKLIQSSASNIKNLTDPQVAPTSYNKNSFYNDISAAFSLGEKELKIAKETASVKKKGSLQKVNDINVEPKDVLTTVNTILKKSVTPSVVIKELESNPELRQFAQRGTELHKKGDRCAFCGNAITDSRWNELDNYFNDEVSKLKKLVHQKINRIDDTLDKIKNIDIPKPAAFYPELEEEANRALLGYTNGLKEIEAFLNAARNALLSKKDNLLKASQPLAAIAPIGVSESTKILNKVITKNNNYTDTLSQKINNAKERLRLNAVKQSLNKIHYSDERAVLSQLEKQRKNAQTDYDNMKRKLGLEEKTLGSLYKETEDESTIARMINRTLAANGHSSFILRLAKDNEYGQSGQYNIIGRNGIERNITELSTGEKNTVAILYFLYSLEAKINKKDSLPLLVVIDDPVNSNDDTMQYMIISEIIKLYKRKDFENNRIIIFTHNTNFFLNVRPYGPEKYSKKKYNSLNLITGLNEKTNIFRITGPENDLKTDYDSLWVNLVSGYINNNPDSMLNNARRICVSFANFNRINVNDFYGESGIKKMLDVNSHEISSEEMKTAGTTAAQLKRALELAFQERNHKEHFDEHWKFGEAVARHSES